MSLFNKSMLILNKLARPFKILNKKFYTFTLESAQIKFIFYRAADTIKKILGFLTIVEKHLTTKRSARSLV
jgi:hypothetical protein